MSWRTKNNHKATFLWFVYQYLGTLRNHRHWHEEPWLWRLFHVCVIFSRHTWSVWLFKKTIPPELNNYDGEYVLYIFVRFRHQQKERKLSVNRSSVWRQGRCRSLYPPLPLCTLTGQLWHIMMTSRCLCCTEMCLNSPVNCLIFFGRAALPVTALSGCIVVMTCWSLCGSWGEFTVVTELCKCTASGQCMCECVPRITSLYHYMFLMFIMNHGLFCAVLPGSCGLLLPMSHWTQKLQDFSLPESWTCAASNIVLWRLTSCRFSISYCINIYTNIKLWKTTQYLHIDIFVFS